jgi:hypothetical protein
MPPRQIGINLTDRNLLSSMSQRKSHPDLEVHVSFEVSHVASECLADAYEHIVPLVLRRIAVHPELAKAPKEADAQSAQGREA